MRSLNSSLPRQPSNAKRKQANSELLQVFKAAALSVTQLYKTAAAEEDESVRDAHHSGYIDALSDVLGFLDERNLGLGDGEGWQVREWATQRHQSLSNHSTGQVEENIQVTHQEEEQRGRSASPTLQHKTSPRYQSASVQTDPIPPASQEVATSTSPIHSSDTFHFQSQVIMPSQQDMDMGSASQRSPPSVRLELLPRSKSSSYRSVHHARGSDRPNSVSLGSLGHGAGSKRKLPLHEFFEAIGPGMHKEGPGSGKRGRFS